MSAPVNSTPDFCSYGFNYRQSKFQGTAWPVDTNAIHNFSALPCQVDQILPNTNDQVLLTAHNQLQIQLFDKIHDLGFPIDSVLGNVLIPWLKTLPNDPDRQNALHCLNMAVHLLDQRAMEKHGFRDSPEEQKVKPPGLTILPSREQWIAMYDQLGARQHWPGY